MTSKSLPPVAKGFPTVEGMNQLMINLSADGAAGAAEVAARIEPGRQKLATHLAQHSAKPVEGMGNLSVNLSADGARKIAASIEAIIMTPEQVANAQRAAAEFRPTKP